MQVNIALGCTLNAQLTLHHFEDFSLIGRFMHYRLPYDTCFHRGYFVLMLLPRFRCHGWTGLFYRLSVGNIPILDFCFDGFGEAVS